MLHLFSLIWMLPFMGLALAQGFITSPKNEDTFIPGTDIIVQIAQMPGSILASQEIVLVFGLQSCPKLACTPVAQGLGDVLLTAPFNPTLQDAQGNLFESFRVTVPSDVALGKAQLSVTNFRLIGAHAQPVLEFSSVNITIAGAII